MNNIISREGKEEESKKIRELLKELTTTELKHIFNGLFKNIEKGNREDIEMYFNAGDLLLERGVDFTLSRGKVKFK